MNDEEKKSLKVLIVILVICLLITLILFFINNKNKKVDKALAGNEYILERETEYSKDESKGKLPLINLKGKEIEEINEEIINNYFDIVNSEYDTYQYEYYIYEDILSLFITITKFDDSEYGNINYYSYNININSNELLTNDELIKYLKLDKNDITETIDTRLKDYYLKDSLNKDISLEQYKERISYKYENVSFVLKENNLYGYVSLTTTQDLTSYPGNINEFNLYKIK
ncbi:MAG: hypothetical protein IJN90_01005 [Bacilli bacterium]|nr:hypothetical protein [Bacilli bacterium]